jgi:hypothetical protein
MSSCSICFVSYSYEGIAIPRILTCGHTYCSKCIQSILTTSSKRSFTCPHCRSEQRGLRKIESYPMNFALLEEITAKEQSQTVAPTVVIAQETMCPHHPQKKYEFYDVICRKFVCSNCVAIGAHGGHKCISLEDFQSQCLLALSRTEKSLPLYIDSLTKGEETTSFRGEMLTGEYSEKQLLIDNFAKPRMRSQRREELQNELKELYLTQAEKLRVHCRKLRELIDSMVALLDQCRDLNRPETSSSSVNCCFLSRVDQLNSSFLELKRSYDSLRSFFVRVATDYDWSTRNPALPRNEFTIPGDPRLEFVPLIDSTCDGVVYGSTTGVCFPSFLLFFSCLILSSSLRHTRADA